MFFKTKFTKHKFLFVLLILLSVIACQQTENKQTEPKKILKVGFDVDDTLLFSTPAFTIGFNSGNRFGTKEFWEVVNKSDKGNSTVKKKALEIVKKHQKNGDEIFVITARKGYGGEPLKEFINEKFRIPKKNIYFAKPKTQKIKELGLDIFYGDSDSDIADAQAVGAIGIRIQRSPKSSNRDRKTGKLNKYHPGKYGEKIIPDSED